MPVADWALSPYPEKVLTFDPGTVVKWYPEPIRHRLATEVAAYRACGWAAPRMLWATGEAICVERCTPLTKAPRDPLHAAELRQLLRCLHATGWNHRDVNVSNLVLHPVRGVLLIDWETAGPAGPSSYDLHGASAAGFPAVELPPHQRPDGVWWGGPGPLAPSIYWGDMGAHVRH